MKETYKKPAQLTLALLISWIVTYGMVFAQPLCCGTVTDSCIPAFNSTQFDADHSIKCRASLSHRCNPPVPAIVSSEILLADFDTDSNCCEKKPCDGFNQTKCFNSSSQQSPNLPVKKFGLVDAIDGFQNTLTQKSLSIPLRLIPIYILTKTIIC